MPIERWRNPPDSALASTQLGQLLDRKLLQPIRRISDDGVNAVVGLRAQPFETVSPNKTRLAEEELFEFSATWRMHLYAGFTKPIKATTLAQETAGRAKPEVASDRRRAHRADFR